MGLKKSCRLTKYKFGIILLAFCFSWLSPILSGYIINFNLVEPLFIFSFYLICKENNHFKNIFKEVILSHRFLLAVGTIFIFFLVGVINSGNLVYPYSDFRVNILFVFLLFLFTNKNWHYEEKSFFIINVVAITTIFDLVSLFFRTKSEDSVKTVISIVLPSILTLYFLRKEKLSIAVIFLIIMIIEAIMGFFRNYYLVSVITILLAVPYLIKYLYKGKKAIRIKIFLIIIGLIIITSYAYPLVYNYWMQDESRQIHSINRTEEFFESSNSESGRVNTNSIVFEDANNFILPYGLGWRAFLNIIEKRYSKYDILSTMDSCFFYLGFHYGIVVCIIVMLFLLAKVFKSFLRTFRDVVYTKFLRYGLFLLFLASFFTQGLMFTTIQGAFSYCLLLSLVIEPI